MLLNVVFTSFNYAVGPPSMTNVRGFIAIKLSRLAVWIESTLTMRDLVLVASVFLCGRKVLDHIAEGHLHVVDSRPTGPAIALKLCVNLTSHRDEEFTVHKQEKTEKVTRK